jgi:hypothetical protein
VTNKDDLKRGVGIALSVFNIGANSATLERVDVIYNICRNYMRYRQLLCQVVSNN